ncbi:MAG: hypothetical protein ACYS0F_13860, partial [Planctomycetota bacterium]
MIGSIGPIGASHAGGRPSTIAPTESGTPAAPVTLTDALRVGQIPGADAAGSEQIQFVAGELIVRLHPRAGSRVHSARVGGFASAMAGDPAAAELDGFLRRHGAKGFRRIFEIYEDADGRQIDTADARLRRSHRARAKQSTRRLPPLPAQTPDLENFFLVEMQGPETF